MGLVGGCPPLEDKPGTGNTGGSNEPDAGGGTGGEEDPCAAVRCKAGRHCEVTEVQCIQAPCPPLVECVLDDEGGAPGCELIDCRPGDKCVEDASGAGSCVPGDGGEVGVECGKNTCAVGEVCCNESCGICTPPDGACIELYCGDPEPSCDLECKNGAHCELKDVTCVKAPCDPIPECVSDGSACLVADCAPGYTCIEGDNGGAECVIDDACAAVRCKDGTHCEATVVECLIAPCPEAAECVPDEECTGPIIDCAAPPEGCNYEGGGCVKGNWTCGTLVCGESCDGFLCKESQHCEMLCGGADGASLKPAPIVCDLTPTCVDDDPCAVLDCASCKVVDGKAQCGTPCGDNTCFNGQECCNASCGWCTDPGTACIQIACDK